MISVMMATRFGSDKKLQVYLTTITEVLRYLIRENGRTLAKIHFVTA